MAGLDPAIHRFRKKMDARVKSAHDGEACMIRWEADERPDPCSLGLLPSGPDPVGEWLVHRQPPAFYIGRMGVESKPGWFVTACPERSAAP